MEEQRKHIAGLNEERSAFNRHLNLLDSQNRSLLEELEQHVRNGEALTKTLDRKERVTDLKERLAQHTDSKSPMRVTQAGFSNQSPLRYRHA